MNKKLIRVTILTVFIITILLLVMAHASLTGYITGRVIDNVTLQPIKGAVVTINDGIIETDEKGMFKIKSSGAESGCEGIWLSEDRADRYIYSTPDLTFLYISGDDKARSF